MQMESASCDELPLRLVSFETRGTMVEYKNSRYRVFDIVAAGKSLSQIRRDIFAGVQGNPPRNTPTPVFTLKMSPFETFFFLSSFRRAKIVDPRDTDSPLSPRIRNVC